MQKSHIPTKKVDGVIEAAHFAPDGRLTWVRAYERRGPTWSDLVLLDRDTLVQRLKAHKRFYIGARREFWASEFELSMPLRLSQTSHGSFLIAGDGNPHLPQDQLEGIPVL